MNGCNFFECRQLLCEIVPQPISIDAAGSKLKNRLKNFG